MCWVFFTSIRPTVHVNKIKPREPTKSCTCVPENTRRFIESHYVGVKRILLLFFSNSLKEVQNVDNLPSSSSTLPRGIFTVISYGGTLRLHLLSSLPLSWFSSLQVPDVTDVFYHLKSTEKSRCHKVDKDRLLLSPRNPEGVRKGGGGWKKKIWFYRDENNRSVYNPMTQSRDS